MYFYVYVVIDKTEKKNHNNWEDMVRKIIIKYVLIYIEDTGQSPGDG